MSDTAAVLEDLAKHLDAKAEVERMYHPADPRAANAYENTAALLRREATRYEPVRSHRG